MKVILTKRRASNGNFRGLRRLLRARRGRISHIARRLGISRQAVSVWRRVPVTHVPVVESVTGVDRRVLRPDFPWSGVGHG